MSEKIRLTPQVSPKLPDPDRREAVRFCPKCGREIPPDRQFCYFCENTGEVRRPVPSAKRKAVTLLIIIVILFLILVLSRVVVNRF